MKVANRGISGDTTRGVLIRLEDDVLSLNPAAVVLLIGTNDLEEGATPETIAGNVKLILAALKRHNPRMPIVLCQVFPSSATKKRPADQIKAINALYLAAVKGDPQVTLLDTWTLFADAKGDAPTEEFPDLLHPNAGRLREVGGGAAPAVRHAAVRRDRARRLQPEEGFESLFNGRDLTGWGIVRPRGGQGEREEVAGLRSERAAVADRHRAGQLRRSTASPDGRFVAINGRLVVTTPPEGRKIQQLWTTREFGDDFTLKLEFRATPNADSGVFVRGRNCSAATTRSPARTRT